MNSCTCSKGLLERSYCKKCKQDHYGFDYHNCKKCDKKICQWDIEIKLAERVKGESRGFYIYCKDCYISL